MTVNPGKSRALKMAALRLASLPRLDRRWLLEQLPAPVRATIGLHVERLLAIAEGDRDLLSEMAAAIDATQAAPAPELIAPTGQTMDQADHGLAALMEDLPVAWVAAVLKIQPESRRAAYLQMQSPERREAFDAASVRLPTRLPQQLENAIRACVDSAMQQRDQAGAGQSSFAELLKENGAESAGAAS